MSQAGKGKGEGRGGSRSKAELDRIDGLISGAMDGELDAESDAELRRIVAEDEVVAARVRAFNRLDSGLRAAASTSDPEMEPRLAANLEALKARLEESRQARSGGSAWVRTRALPLLLAAAAALALYLGFSASGPAIPDAGLPVRSGDAVAVVTTAPAETGVDNEFELGRASNSNTDQTTDTDTATVINTNTNGGSGIEDEMAWALGYLEDPSDLEAFPGSLLEDLEIIEQLEFLDFLAAREAGAASRREERG